ncbi:MAG TPA: PEP-CTERM sorting domain-containing protein [Fimbriimonas sp.]|nr:PEP-CTERM sorting domain-containing protein [Fimbriimonas sp.]
MKIKIALLASLGLSAFSFGDVVYSNNFGGDAFTDPGTSNPGASQLITSYVGPQTQVWVYNEVKDDAIVGIDMVQPRSGNGSAHIQTLGGSNTNGKASISMGRLDANPLGSFDSLTSWSADVYTASSDFANQAMVLRMYVSNGTTQGYLVFDTTWVPGNAPVMPFGQWNNVDFVANSSSLYLRATNSLATAFGSSEQTFGSWQSALSGGNYQVLSVNAGFGTSSGAFDGFVDNYSLGFGGNTTTYNFEANAVPEPASMAALGAGALALLRRRNRKQK